MTMITEEKFKPVMTTDSESNITTIKNTEDYRNFLKKESSEIINFDEKKCSVFAPKSRNTNKHVKLHFEKQFTRKC